MIHSTESKISLCLTPPSCIYSFGIEPLCDKNKFNDLTPCPSRYAMALVGGKLLRINHAPHPGFAVCFLQSGVSVLGEGSGNPLQCCCLENPMDRGAWQATVHRVAKDWTRLKLSDVTATDIDDLRRCGYQGSCH